MHRWYRLTPSYSPGLVRYLVSELKVGGDDLVFDPFSGRGTTVIECQRLGLRAVGGEINPLLQQVADRSLRWNPAAVDPLAAFGRSVERTIREEQRSLDELLAEGEVRLPDIHDVFRWWRRPVLRDLLLARRLAERMAGDAGSYAWLVMNTVCLDCANIHRNHPTITFDDDHSRDLDVAAEITRRVAEIAIDLRAMPSTAVTHTGDCRVVLADARRDPRESFGEEFKPSVVVCSPPYPNRFSYVHQTRPQLHFMSVIDHRSKATEIDLASIGGTWGRATSNLMKHDLPIRPELEGAFDFYPALRRRSLLMANYAVKYFTDLFDHLRTLRARTSPGFRGAYIVGNSRLSTVEIYTEAVLCDLCRRAGFKVERVVVFRKRGGRKRLYESAVFIEA